MKRSSSITRYLLIDPLALTVACIISLLFANATQQYLNTAKRNLSDTKNQTVVCFQVDEYTSPEELPTSWKFEKPISLQKNNDHLSVTSDLLRDYCLRLRGCFYGLSQPQVWLPSIPVAYRKLII